MEEELISVIINVYNGEKFIKKCLDSVVNQTYKDLEIIIVNDGSTDNTLKICESYNDKRIKIITTINLGLSMSRNIGIDNAQGEYLYFIDVDDFIELDTIEYLYNLCNKYNVDLATSKSLDVYNYSLKLKKYKEKVNIISNKDMLKKILLAEDNAVAIWNKLIKKDLLKSLRFEKRIANDIAFTYKLVMATSKIAYSNQIKYYYFKHRESICAMKREDFNRTIDMYNIALERYEAIKRKYPKFIENEVGIMEITSRFYLRKNESIIQYLDEHQAIELFNKVFTIKFLKCKMKYREKLKIILFRINPKFQKEVIKKYLQIKEKLK